MVARRDTPRVDLELVGDFAAPNLGSRLMIDWENVTPAISGYCKMLTGLLITATVAFTGDAVAMPNAMPGVRVLDFLESLKLKIGTHALIEGMGGLRLWHDHMRCNGSAPLVNISDVADASASGTRDVVFHLQFTPGNLHEDAQLDGALPVAALRRTDLELKLSSGDFGGFPGVTCDAITDVKVYAVVRASHKVIVPPMWSIRAITDSRKDGVLTPPVGFLYYCDIYDTDRGGAPETDTADYTDAQFTIGQERLATYTDAFVPAMLHNFLLERDSLAETLDSAAPRFFPLIRSIPRGGLASKQPTGPIRFKFGAGPHDDTTYQFRSRGTRHDGWRQEIFTRLGVNPHAVGIAVQAAGGGSVAEVLVPHLAESIVWRGMEDRFPAVAEQNAKKFALAL